MKRLLIDFSPMGLVLVIVIALAKLVTTEGMIQKHAWPCEPPCSGPPTQCPEPGCS